MKFRLRTLMMAITVFAILLAGPAYVITSVMPENRRISNSLTQQLGKRFMETGIYPKRTTLRFSDLKHPLDLPLQETTDGTVSNRWGEEIQVCPVLIDEMAGTKTLSLTVISSGPFGSTGVCSNTAIFEFDSNK